MSNLKETYTAFAGRFGRDLAAAIANSFGATNGLADDVPAARRDGLAAAMQRILRGEGHMSMAQAKVLAHGGDLSRPDEQEDVFGAIRAKAFGTVDDDEDARPATKLDPVAIYKRWRASKRMAEN